MKNKIILTILGIFLLSFVTSAVYGTQTSSCPVCQTCINTVINETTCAKVIDGLNNYSFVYGIIGLLVGLIIGNKLGNKKKKKHINNQQPSDIANIQGDGKFMGKVHDSRHLESGTSKECPSADISDDELNELIDESGIGKDVKETFDNLNKRKNGEKIDKPKRRDE